MFSLSVTLESIVEFRGILLQARRSDTAVPVGTWQPKDGYNLLTCTNPGDSLTHNSADIKGPNVQFQWTAPSSSMGAISIM